MREVVLFSLVPGPCAFVVCSTQYEIRGVNFVLQVTNAQGLGTRLSITLQQKSLWLDIFDFKSEVHWYGEEG